MFSTTCWCVHFKLIFLSFSSRSGHSDYFFKNRKQLKWKGKPLIDIQTIGFRVMRLLYFGCHRLKQWTNQCQSICGLMNVVENKAVVCEDSSTTGVSTIFRFSFSCGIQECFQCQFFLSSKLDELKHGQGKIPSFKYRGKNP